ncbi:Cytochrome P450 family protein, partial [Metarhizium majus ARSEF 297]
MGKVSDDEGKICGKHIPAGTWSGARPWLLCMATKPLVGDGDIYEPRRRPDAEPGNLKQMEAIYGLVFATGAQWEFFGKRLAYVEMSKVIFEFFCRFDMSMISPMEPSKWVNHGLTARYDVNIRFI